MNIPEDLRHAARSANLNLLVGSGISTDAGLPGWSAILQGLGNCISDQASLRPIERLIAQGRMLDAAELLRAEISTERICERLKHLLPKIPRKTKLADAVWDVRPKFVMTTNYDSVLETSLARTCGVAGSVLIPGVNVPPMISETENSIAKIHGDLSAPESIVLSRGDYFRAMLSIDGGFGGIWGEFVRRPTLAIGYSLRDPDLQLLLHWTKERLRGFSHSLFIAIPGIEEEERRLLTLLPGVVILDYDATNGHQRPLLELLHQLKRERDSRDQTIPSPLEIRGAMLGHFNRRINAYLHDARGAVSAATLISDIIERGGFANVNEKLLKRAFDAFKKVGSDLVAIADLVRAGEGHLVPSIWQRVRDVVIADLDDQAYAMVTRTVADSSNVELPIGERLYSVLVRVLVDNAIEASANRDDFQVSLDLQFKSIDGRQMLITEVRDKGVGISAQVKNRLFEPNVSSKGDGRGLGLYLLRALAREVGGGVELSCSPGKGTVAVFWLPICATAESPSLQAKLIDHGTLPRLDNLDIVLIDDHEQMLAALCSQLNGIGANVQTYRDGESALAELLKLKDCPDCIVTDVVMPRMSGFDLLRSVRVRWPLVPVVFYSGYAYTSTLIHDNSGPFGEHIAFLEKGEGDMRRLSEAILSAIGGTARQTPQGVPT
jgi:signal transduction histidine kinase